ncbi:MAG TPA: c-type cytochrome [Anaerolineales bacterium]|nr:c-type cytochrome [Anaerolineales bacterium]
MADAPPCLSHAKRFGLALVAGALGVSACAPLDQTPSATTMPAASPSPLAVDPLALERQTDRADPIYRLWCKSCHGDALQGLTVEFRMTWPEEDQNCWQSKCHSENHPPGGFILPRTVPALVGPGALSKFPTAAELYAFIRAAMPFQEPGILDEQDYWDLTAYLLRKNGLPIDDSGVGPDNASSIELGS